MKLSSREKFLLGLLLVIITAAAYLVVYLLPTMDRIGQTRLAIADNQAQLELATLRIPQYEGLSRELARLQQIQEEQERELNRLQTLWQTDYMAAIPVHFDDAGLSRHIQATVFPRASFPEVRVVYVTAPSEFGPHLARVAEVRFTATYTNLINILTDFAQQQPRGRVVRYRIAPGEAIGMLNVDLTIEYLIRSPY